MMDAEIITALQKRLPNVLEIALKTEGASKQVSAAYVRFYVRQDLVNEMKDEVNTFVRHIWDSLPEDEKDRLLEMAFPDGKYPTNTLIESDEESGN